MISLLVLSNYMKPVNLFHTQRTFRGKLPLLWFVGESIVYLATGNARSSNVSKKKKRISGIPKNVLSVVLIFPGYPYFRDFQNVCTSDISKMSVISKKFQNLLSVFR